jgi:hypothetical protein
MNQVAIKATSSPPGPATPALAANLARLSSAVEVIDSRKCSISSQRAPTPAERGELQGRLSALSAGLAVAGFDRAMELVAPILALYGTKSMTDGEKRGTLRMYGDALRNFPEWAITETLLRFNRGGFDQDEFAPKPATIAKVCSEICAVHHDERAKIQRLLTAEVYHEPTAEERERVAGGLQALAKECADKANAFKPQPESTLDLNDPEAIKQRFREAAANSSLNARADSAEEAAQ